MCDYCEKLKAIFTQERKDSDKLYDSVYKSRKERTDILFAIADCLGIKYGNGDWSILKFNNNPILKKLSIKEK